MNVCIFEQTCGLGDILMSIKIGCHFASQGYRVVWPVEPIYRNLQSNVETQLPIEFPCVQDQFEFKDIYESLSRTEISNVTKFKEGILYVPLRRAFHSNQGIEMRKFFGSDEVNMLGKFAMCGLTHDNWQSYFSINRNAEKEAELMKALQINSSDKIHLVNKEFGTPPRWREVLERDIPTPKGLKRLEMRIVEGYDLFDWCGVFEKASKIDTVTTSNFYIFEKINLMCVPTIYSKNNFMRSWLHNWGWMEKLASKEYNYIT